MKKGAMSKEKILQTGRILIREEGWSAMNIRTVAALCGVSVGSIYNYFDSKAAFVGDVVESIWREIFHLSEGTNFSDTLACVAWMYERMAEGDRRYPGFFTLHSLGFDGSERSDGKMRMIGAWAHILAGLTAVIERDPRVRADAWTEDFTPEIVANLLFSLMLSAVVRGDFDAKPVLELVRRTLY